LSKCLGFHRQRKVRARGRRNLDLNFERRDRLAALHLDLDSFLLDREMLGDNAQDFFAQNRGEAGFAGNRALMREQDLQPFISAGKCWRL
jgi:hypothetical protein